MTTNIKRLVFLLVFVICVAVVQCKQQQQYFKPSIDGSSLTNERQRMLTPAPTTTTSAPTTSPLPKITVPSIIGSFFQLFDNLKATLTNVLAVYNKQQSRVSSVSS